MKNKKNKSFFFSAVILAAGQSLRMGRNINKQMLVIDSKPVILRTLEVFNKNVFIDEIIVVAALEMMEDLEKLILENSLSKAKVTVVGGSTRFLSAQIGVEKADEKCTHILIHDGARPFVSHETINSVMEGMTEHGACAPALEITDTVKKIMSTDENTVDKTMNRADFKTVQTPQGFELNLYKKAVKGLINGDEYFDDTQLIELLGEKVHLVEGEKENIKITVQDDIIMSQAILYVKKWKGKIGDENWTWL